MNEVPFSDPISTASGFVDGGVDYVTDLSIPTDAATYLAFPTPGRCFGVLLEFGDGDFIDQVGPYQHAATELRYDITSLSVTAAVPEPAGMLAALAAALPCLNRRRRLRPPASRPRRRLQ
jgi:hypothetical protein